MISAMRHDSRAFVSSLVLLAVLVRAMIPSGFMPDLHNSAGLFPLVICSGLTGTKTVYLPAEKIAGLAAPSGKTGAGKGHHQDNGCHAPCVFSAAFVCGLVEHGPEIIEIGVQKTPNPPPAPVTIVAEAFSNAYFPQGPPSFFLHT